MSTSDWQDIADRLNAHLVKARLSSNDVAARAGVDRKTVDRLRAGQAVRATTLQWIEQALKIELAGRPAAAERDVAPIEYGGYRREVVAGYAGHYTAYRRSFDTRGSLIASTLIVTWDDSVPALRFSEDQRNLSDAGKSYRYHFGGDVLIPPNLGVMHFLVRSGDGRVRLISTSMPREEHNTLVMKGFIMTLNEIMDIGYYPVTSPIFIAKAGDTPAAVGVVGPEDERFEWAARILEDIERKYLPFRG